MKDRIPAGKSPSVLCPWRVVSRRAACSTSSRCGACLQLARAPASAQDPAKAKIPRTCLQPEISLALPVAWAPGSDPPPGWARGGHDLQEIPPTAPTANVTVPGQVGPRHQQIPRDPVPCSPWSAKQMRNVDDEGVEAAKRPGFPFVASRRAIPGRPSPGQLADPGPSLPISSYAEGWCGMIWCRAITCAPPLIEDKHVSSAINVPPVSSASRSAR